MTTDPLEKAPRDLACSAHQGSSLGSYDLVCPVRSLGTKASWSRTPESQVDNHYTFSRTPSAPYSRSKDPSGAGTVNPATSREEAAKEVVTQRAQRVKREIDGMGGSIIVINASSGPCHVFVSKYSHSSGHDDWFTLGPGQRDSWSRDGWEVVAFKNDGDTDRSGVYVNTNSTVTYHDLHNITT
ncbi:hypothetical protein C8Q77DRAFT_1159815 [Trametes polyzona]|nr:hypothetical protein C8Q77DRAFT_1159815 [Trametes polyzona]